MKTLRFILAFSLIAGLIVPQVPSQASCQMSMGLFGFVCPMPCCKTTPMPAKCQIRTAPVRDAIVPSTYKIQNALQVIFTIAPGRVMSPLFHTAFLKHITHLTTSLFPAVTPLIRAPPIEYVLFSA